MRLPPERPNDPVWTSLRDHDLEELWDDTRAPHVAATYRARMRHNMDVLKRVMPPGGSMVDVGCAQGTLGLLMAEQGYAVTLLDMRPAALEYARARHERGHVEYRSGDLFEGALGESRFDIVVTTETLEHVPAPARFIERLLQHVKPGGHLYVTTPNGEYAFSRLPTYGGANQSVVDGAVANSSDGADHRYLFTLGELTSILRGLGLGVDEKGFILPFWLEGHAKTRMAHRALALVRGAALASDASLPAGVAGLGVSLCSCIWALAHVTPGNAQPQANTGDGTSIPV